MRAATFIMAAGLAFPIVGARADDPPKVWEFTGRAQAATVDVRARVAGHLARVAVREGETVAKGDLLAEIDPRAYQLDLEAARARLTMAEAQLQEAKIKAANAKKLLEKQLVGQGELDLHAADEAEAAAALAVARVDVHRAELTLSWTRITAPCDGRVSHVRATEGGLVTADQSQLLTVVAAEPLYVTFNVPETILLRLRRDGSSEPDKLSVAVGFALDEGFPHAAKLDLIEPEVDPETGTARFRAVVPNPEGLFSPGMSARVRLTPALR